MSEDMDTITADAKAAAANLAERIPFTLEQHKDLMILVSHIEDVDRQVEQLLAQKASYSRSADRIGKAVLDAAGGGDFSKYDIVGNGKSTELVLRPVE